ncbi:hypothetical protein ACIGCK_09295 [Microbacterium sp. NPDC078428]|uniref:hypothetical protein n=1 Tax=Microbacterium sp. NPDC078428 TaxID=3364190 RepID=UPI0037C988BE
MSSGLPPTLAELIALVEGEPARSQARDAELALGDATGLALADVPSRTAQTWRTCAPELVRLIVIHAARRAVGNPRGVYLTSRERTLIRRAHTPTRPRSTPA